MRNNKVYPSLYERILAFHKVNAETGCWEWQSYKTQGGYGGIRSKNKNYRAHRVAYELFVGPIPDGRIVMHKCDNRACINPEHLSIGTNKENSTDMVIKGRQYRKLSVADVLKIRADTRKASVACRDYGIGKTQFGYIRQGIRWTHV